MANAAPLRDRYEHHWPVHDRQERGGTQELIRGFLADDNVKGAVIDEPWRNFA